MQAEEFLTQYAAGQREFEEANLSGVHLSGSTLIAIDLSGAVLQNADLSAANLSSSKLIGADLNGVNLKGAKLLSTNLSGAELNRANLAGANLLGANLSGANLVNADLQGANLSGADLYYANLRGANLTNANLRGASLSQTNLSMVCLAGARLEGTDLSDAVLDTPAQSQTPRSLQTLQSQTLGEFINDLPDAKEYLTISFSPGSIPLQQRWRNNGLSADFMADYFSTFFLDNEQDNKERNTREDVKGGVGFIANELLENAMKFSDKSSSIDTCIRLHLYEDKLVFLAINAIDQPTVEKFQAFIQELLHSDPNELYLLQLERNAEDEESMGSGLGLLTMINDYSAKLGWQFTPLPNRPDQFSVKTMVQLLV